MQRIPMTICAMLTAVFLVGLISLVVRAEDTSSQDATTKTEVTPDEVAASSPDGGVDTADAGAQEAAKTEETPQVAQTSKSEDKDTTDKPEEGLEVKTEKPKLHWRKDPSVRRRTGSYMGGGMAYANSRAWYHVKLREYENDYEVGPLHGSYSFVRVGDAFFEWFAVGFQIALVSTSDTYGATAEKAIAGFALFLDTSFYPWRGLALRPSVGLGFAYAMSGTRMHEFGLGGPACLGFALSYEFRISRLFTIAPVAQISWIAGEDFDSMFLTFGIQFLKWFVTAEG